MKIPEEYQQLCKDLAKVLRKFNEDHGYMSVGEDYSKEKTIFRFNGQLMVNSPNMTNINFNWQNGRHGDDMGRIIISADIRVDTAIDEKP